MERVEQELVRCGPFASGVPCKEREEAVAIPAGSRVEGRGRGGGEGWDIVGGGGADGM